MIQWDFRVAGHAGRVPRHSRPSSRSDLRFTFITYIPRYRCDMKPVRPSITPALFKCWKALAADLGCGFGGVLEEPIDLTLDYADALPATAGEP